MIFIKMLTLITVFPLLAKYNPESFSQQAENGFASELSSIFKNLPSSAQEGIGFIGLALVFLVSAIIVAHIWFSLVRMNKERKDAARSVASKIYIGIKIAAIVSCLAALAIGYFGFYIPLSGVH